MTQTVCMPLHKAVSEMISSASNALHASSHDHVLQDMTMHHPHPWIFDSQPPCAPAGIGVLGLLVSVSIDVRHIAEHGVVVCKLGFVGAGVIGAVSGADVVEVAAVGVPRVVVEAVVVVDVGGFVVDDDLEDLDRTSVQHSSQPCHQGILEMD